MAIRYEYDGLNALRVDELYDDDTPDQTDDYAYDSGRACDLLPGDGGDYRGW